LCGAKRLKKLGRSISTSLIEGVNLTFRHSLAPLVRKSYSFCKEREPMRRRVLFFQTFYNFARPHMSLRLPLPKDQQHRVGLIRHKWADRSPAMAAGISDRIWSFRMLKARLNYYLILLTNFESLKRISVIRLRPGQ
jgi:hypothetical protein